MMVEKPKKPILVNVVLTLDEAIILNAFLNGGGSDTERIRQGLKRESAVSDEKAQELCKFAQNTEFIYNLWSRIDDIIDGK